MDLISNVHMIATKNDKKFVFVIPVGSNWGETYDACFDCLLEISKLSREAAEKMAQAKEARPDQAGE